MPAALVGPRSLNFAVSVKCPPLPSAKPWVRLAIHVCPSPFSVMPYCVEPAPPDASSRSTMFMTPAIASEPYWADAPSRRISTRLIEDAGRSEEPTSELQSQMRISYDVFCLKKTQHTKHHLQS